MNTEQTVQDDGSDAEIVGMIRKACKELTGKNATFADDDLRAIVERAAAPSDTHLLRDALEALAAYDAYLEIPQDRGGKTGPKGAAFQNFIDRKNSALSRARKAGVL